jgi:hypothetical protein
MTRKNQAKKKPKVINVSRVLKNIPLEDRSWDRPEVLKVNESLWTHPDRAIEGVLSRIDYFSPGFRRGIVQAACEILANEGAHFITLMSLVRKDFFKEVLKQRMVEAKAHIAEQRAEAKRLGQKMAGILEKDIREHVTENIVDEAAKALAAMLPKIKKPGTPTEYIRYYVATSKKYDGEIGERIARRLQELRPSDIRKYHPGSIRTELKSSDIVFWTLGEMKSRIPSAFVSQAIEKIITDKEAETSRKLPDLWLVGGNGTAIYTPDGVRRTPYVGTPGASAPEGVSIGENQIGVAIVEQDLKDPKNRLVRFYNLRDAVSRERKMITGIKRGSHKIHQAIVDELKREGGTLSVGQLADRLGIADRTEVENALKFLELTSASDRKTWPGLHYDSASQLWDFHREWIQQRLRYVLPPRNKWVEDNLFFFACMHAGYTTSDYRFIVDCFPQIMLQRNTQTVVCLGDMIAGLHHNFLCSGEVFSGLNNTEQEEFAAALLATVFRKVFVERFNLAMRGHDAKDPVSIHKAIEYSLMNFVYIPGNHDLWQQQDGSTPLKIFHAEFVRLLSTAIVRNLINRGAPMMDIDEILKKKIFPYTDVRALHTLSSDLNLAMSHPHMGGSLTTSRNAQNMVGVLGSQIGGIANFHRATVVHRWDQELGQCVVVQAGTMAIYTPFEVRKMKFQNDFGPITLRVLSHEGRILTTEIGYHNQALLKEEISKHTDIRVLKNDLNLLSF